MSNSPPAELIREILACTGASHATPAERIQSLWSGYGEIRRFALEGGDAPSVIVKWIDPPTAQRHPRGWNTDRSHERKLRSYEVERAWYADFAARCDDACRVPRQRAWFERDGAAFGVLEDLDAAGFPERRADATHDEVRAVLDWLAHFHATFIGVAPKGLWPVGTYWHLETRPDELQVMRDAGLREAAPELDRRLNTARHQSLVHGDAKLANFCFPPSAGRVAAVDFQYVGGGVGIKDVMYFLSSCFFDRDLERHAQAHLDHYFVALSRALESRRPDVDAAAVVDEWRALYPIAWADFVRFLDGWSPSHRKLHGYSWQVTRDALASL